MEAILLLAHGSRVDGWARPFEAVDDRLRAARPDVPTALAFLEFMQPDFVTACDRLVATGALRIVVCPLFLGVGGHVAREMPPLIEAARARWPATVIDCERSIGEEPLVIEAIAQSIAGRL